jgi:ABC-2 type transport system permease protein
MPQLGLLFMLVYLPMNMLSRQQYPARKYAPVARNGDAGIVINSFRLFCAGDPLSRRRHLRNGPEFVIVALVGGLFFALAILRFRSVAA